MSKKMFLAMLIMLTGICLSAASVTAKKQPSAPRKQTVKELEEIMRTAYPASALRKVRTVKFVYEISGQGVLPSYLVIRAKEGEKVRIDVIEMKNSYSFCRNGQDFWWYEQGKKFEPMNQKDAEDMTRDLTLFPLPFAQPHAFMRLKQTGSGVYRAERCDVYTTHAAKNAEELFAFWVNAKTKLVSVVKQDLPDGKYSMSYSNYQDFDGLKLASLINYSNPDGLTSATLISFDANREIPDSLFVRSEPLKDGSLMLLRRSLEKRGPEVQKQLDQTAAMQKEVKKQAKKLAEEQRIAEKKQLEATREERAKRKEIALEREIRILPIRIAEKQKRIAQLEKIINEDRRGVYDIASRNTEVSTPRFFEYRPHVRRGRHSHHGWFFRSGRIRSRNTAEQKRLARGMEQEVVAAVREYDKLTREVTDMQIELGDAQAALKRLREEKKK